jgi:hypothetical protein
LPEIAVGQQQFSRPDRANTLHFIEITRVARTSSDPSQWVDQWLVEVVIQYARWWGRGRS